MAPATTVREQQLRDITARAAALETEASGDITAAETLAEQLAGDGHDVTDVESDAFKQIDEAYQVASEKRQQAATLRQNADRIMGELSNTAPERNAINPTVSQNWAEKIMGSHGYENLPRMLDSSGNVGELPLVELLDRNEMVSRLRQGGNLFAVATGDVTGGIALDQQLYPPVPILRRKITLLDFINIGSTDTASVVYAQQTTRTGAAAETALGTAYSEASFAWTKITAPVQSIGHFTTVYREQVADAAQFQTIIEQQLSEDVQLRLESEILNGDGTGSNLTGILAAATAIASVRQNESTEEPNVQAIHRAITVCRLAYREPTMILMHPSDFETTLFDRAGTDSSGNYLWLGSLAGLSPGDPATLWGLPVVSSPVISAGTGVVAYWKDATLWMREGVSVRISDSHSTYFTERKLAVLAELRAAFSVTRPGVFCSVDFTRNA